MPVPSIPLLDDVDRELVQSEFGLAQQSGQPVLFSAAFLKGRFRMWRRIVLGLQVAIAAILSRVRSQPPKGQASEVVKLGGV